jgi:hypothetical protein
MAKHIDTRNEYLGKEAAFNIGVLGTGEPPEIEVIDRVVPPDVLEIEKFMQEMVTVMVADSNDENDTELVQVSVNGNRQFFQRGRPQEVKRYFVERLARAKRTTYSQNLDERQGEAMNNMIPRHALRYPFTVVEDKNPKGGAWLRGILAERN